MIKVQLCPQGELEDKQWWVKDVAVLLAVAIGLYLAVDTYIAQKRSDIESLNAKESRWIAELAAKRPMIEKFKNLQSEIGVLNHKIEALKRITTSRIDKVKPLVAMDQLQTLWMEGVWYDTLVYGVDGATTVTGAAKDGLLIGEYMLGVRETMTPETVNDDLRTQVGFDAVALKSVKEDESQDRIFQDIRQRMVFELNARHVEKPRAAVGAVSFIPRPRASGVSGF